MQLWPGISSENLSVVHTVGSLRTSAGGPTRTVTSLCSELGRNGLRVSLVSQNAESSVNDVNLVPDPRLVSTQMALGFHLPFGQTIWSPFFAAKLNEQCIQTSAMLIHDHGVWLPSNHSAAVSARRLKVPLIVSPRGMLEPWAMAHRCRKKSLAWSLYQRRDLSSARVLHATAQQEADNLRAVGLMQPIAVIPNGVDLTEWTSFSKEKKSKRVVLFLSRIHPKKGILELVEAWRRIKPNGWRVIIAGPDEGGHLSIVKQSIRAAGLENDFEFAGNVEGTDKIELYRNADLFVLPSFSENFGVVVAEALSHRLPVITTRGTPWRDLEAFGCGWWIPIGVEPLVAALRDALSLTDERRREMGERGELYVKRYDWKDIGKRMVEVYRWVLGLDSLPDCVQLY